MTATLDLVPTYDLDAEIDAFSDDDERLQDQVAAMQRRRRELVVAAYLAGMKWDDITTRLRVNKRTVIAWLTDEGIDTGSRPRGRVQR